MTTTTVRGLTDELKYGVDNEELILTLSPSSDYGGLTRIINGMPDMEEDTDKTRWTIQWCEDFALDDDDDFIGASDLIKAIADHNAMEHIHFAHFPYQIGYMAKVTKILRAGNNSLSSLVLCTRYIRYIEESEITAEEAEISTMLEEFGQWKELVQLELKLSSTHCFRPSLLCLLAQSLPKLTVTELRIHLHYPCGINSEAEDYTRSVKDAYDQLQAGLQDNCDLEELEIGFTRWSWQRKLWGLMDELKADKLDLFLELNRGRKEALEIPSHSLRQWVDFISSASSWSENKEAILYYFLRQNTWMFAHAESSKDNEKKKKKKKTGIERRLGKKNKNMTQRAQGKTKRRKN